jgi:hypothetical protein
MSKPNGWKNAAILFALCAMTTIAAGAQTFALQT